MTEFENKKRRKHSKEPESSSRKNPDSGIHKEERVGPEKDPSITEPRRIRGKRLWTFRLLAIFVVPLLFLLISAIGLRIFDYGYPTTFTLKKEINGRQMIVSNGHFTKTFFSSETLREGLPFALPAEKGPDSYRVFVIGESAAFGDPNPGFGIARFLEAMLPVRYPDVDFETVNAAIPAVSSHTALLIARECVRLDADLLVLYMGNNEVTGPYGAGTTFTKQTLSVPLIRLDIALKSSRIGQFLKNLTDGIGLFKREIQPLHTMETYFKNQVRASDPRLQKVYNNFERNLRDILKAAKEAGIPVVVGTVGVNLKDFAPLASLHRSGLPAKDLEKWESAFKRGVDYEKGEDYKKAVEEYQTANNIDDKFADLWFRMGRCLWKLEDYAKADECFVKARDLDTLRFRVDSRLNAIIRRTAGERSKDGVFLVDGESLMEQNCAHGVAGDEVFYDHAHMRFNGNYLLSKGILEQVEQTLPDRLRKKASDKPVPSEEDCARRLAYTGWDRFSMASEILSRMKRPPYVNQSNHEERVGTSTGEVRELKAYTGKGTPQFQEAAAAYKAALETYPADWMARSQYASHLRDFTGDAAEVEKQMKMVVDLSPEYWAGRYTLAGSLLIQKKYEGAEQCYRDALKEDPDEARASANMGGFLLETKKYPESMEFSRKAVAINPYQLGARMNLGACLKALGADSEENERQAIEQYMDILKTAPDHKGARTELGWIYYEKAQKASKENKTGEAIQLLKKSVEMNPDFAQGHGTLAGMLEKEGDIDGAVKHVSEVIRLNPNNVEARSYMQKLKGLKP